MLKYSFFVVLCAIFVVLPVTFSLDTVPIPAAKAEVQKWFTENVKPLKDRAGTLDPPLAAAEAAPPRLIKILADGKGDFKTITEAINSIPVKNTKRVIISIGPGEYKEKIKILRDKPFITFRGDPKAMPTLVFNGDAAKYGTVESGTLTVDSDYFVAVNLIIRNSSPRPDGKRAGAQAAAMRIGGDKATFYNVKFYGFQDTLCDDKGRHFFKDCFIDGTLDFIFGNGRSIYLNTELHTIPGDPETYITAHARDGPNVDTGYVFVHCPVTGTGKSAMLGRAWRPYSKTVFAYCDMSDVVNPKGWSVNKLPPTNLFFGEFQNTGPGASPATREPFVKKLTPAEANRFISLSYIEGSKWLLPPPL